MVISLTSSYKCLKILKTSKGVIELSFKPGFSIEDDEEIPKYMKFVCPKCRMAGLIKQLQKENNIQPDIMKGGINHNVINISNYKEYESSWKLYLIDNVLRLAYLVAKHGNHIQKITGVFYKTV